MGNNIGKIRIVCLAFLACAITATAQVPADYQARYATLAGKSGASLFSALESIAAEGYTTHSYADLWTLFLITDLNASGKIWDMYSSCTFTPQVDQCGNYSSVCTCYNREHSLPKSWFGGSKDNPPGNDLFHLIPTDGRVNSQRGDSPFGECANGSSLGGHALGKLGSSTLEGFTNIGSVFEPDDMYKGDFARSYFGMIVRYGTSYDLSQSNGNIMFSNSGSSISAANRFGLTAYSVALLMKWTRQDTVSAKEIARNNGIQTAQGNRNPFIDCPIVAEYLWGTKAGDSVTIDDLLACGCVDSTYFTALDEVIAGTSDEVSRLASVNVAGVAEGLSFSCLPHGARVLLFDARGMLLTEERASTAELAIAVGSGFYLAVVAINNETRAMKVKK